MKKTLYRIIVLLITGALLLSLSGCGALFNGDKQLTDDKLVPSDSSSSSSGPTSDSIPRTLKINKMYYLTDSGGSKYIWFIFPKTNDSLYFIRLNRSGTNKYSYVKEKALDYESNGWDYFPESSLYDGYVFGKKDYSSNYSNLSNLITKDQIIKYDFEADKRDYVINCPIEHIYSSSNSQSTSGQTSRPLYSNSRPTPNYYYLWVHLNDSATLPTSNELWVCLGSASGCSDPTN